MISRKEILQQLIYLLIQGRVRERFNFNIDEIERYLWTLELSSSQRDFVQEQIDDYREDAKLSLWNDNNFKRLSRRLTDILKVRDLVENAAFSSTDVIDLTNRLLEIVKSFSPNASKEFVLTLSQCFMKDLSIGLEEPDKRKALYIYWVDSILKRSDLL
jgi:hypothetical protein